MIRHGPGLSPSAPVSQPYVQHYASAPYANERHLTVKKCGYETVQLSLNGKSSRSFISVKTGAISYYKLGQPLWWYEWCELKKRFSGLTDPNDFQKKRAIKRTFYNRRKWWWSALKLLGHFIRNKKRWWNDNRQVPFCSASFLAN